MRVKSQPVVEAVCFGNLSIGDTFRWAGSSCNPVCMRIEDPARPKELLFICLADGVISKGSFDQKVLFVWGAFVEGEE